MAAEKLIKILSDVKLLWGAILLIIPIGIWAADTVFQTDKEAAIAEIRQMKRVIKDMEIQRDWAETPRKKQEMERRISNIKDEIDQLELETGL